MTSRKELHAMKMPWEKSVVDVKGALPLLDAMEKCGVGAGAPMVFAERKPQLRVSTCEACGAAQRPEAPGPSHLRGCRMGPEPCEHCVPEGPLAPVSTPSTRGATP